MLASTRYGFDPNRHPSLALAAPGTEGADQELSSPTFCVIKFPIDRPTMGACGIRCGSTGSLAAIRVSC
jgi:hypothetical protein